MNVFPISDPFSGEKIADVLPAPRRFVEDGERSARLNFFPGRHLTDTAFSLEHRTRVGHLLLSGQAVSAGVVDGLEVRLGDAKAGASFTCSPGFGLTVSGEDVMLDRQVVVAAGDLAVFDLAAGKVTGFLRDQAAIAAARAGVLVWQPVSLPDTDIPLAAITEGFDQNFNPSDRMPDDEAYYRKTRTDAARLVLCFWPESWRAQPAFGERWQNRLAWEIFAAERAGESPPWLAVGLPVALVGFEVGMRALFADTHAVVRRGGRPRIRTLRADAAEPRLWQAQVDQFVSQLTQLSASASPITHFRFVPAVGLLPKTMLGMDKDAGPSARWKFAQRLFPPTYRVELAVAPLEQMDAVFAAARDLDPFDIFAPDAVRLLLPIAQRFFDPQLLDIAEIAAEFLETVTKLTEARDVWRARRDDLRAKASTFSGALTAKAAAFPDPDSGQVDSAEAPATIPTDAAEEMFGITATGGALKIDSFETVKDDLGKFLKQFTAAEKTELNTLGLTAYREHQEKVQTDEQGALARLGLRGFIDYLEEKATRADSLVDRGFLTINADIYRLGQLLNNNALGTQAAASPSLGATVVRESPRANAASMSLFASRLFADLPMEANDTPAAAAPAVAAAAGAGLRGTALRASTISAARFGSVHDFVSAGEQFSTAAGVAQLSALDNAVAADPAARLALENLKKASVLDAEKLVQFKNLADFADAYVPNLNVVTTKQLRTLPLERLTPPAAPTIRQKVGDTKLAVFDKLAQLDISLADLTTDFVEKPTGQTTSVRFSFQKVLAERSDPLDLNITDETAHFTKSVRHADLSVSALRAVERRIQSYRELIALCRDRLAIIDAQHARLQARLKVVDDELAEARSDVAVAQALQKEEESRIEEINSHREQILRDHVGFLVFHRPRTVEARVEAPVRAIEPALRVAPVPACLEDNLPQPPDFATLAEVFRDAPARWFIHAPRWIRLLDRVDHLRDFVLRAIEPRFTTVTPPLPVASSGRFSAAISKVFTARQAVSVRSVSAVRTLKPTIIAGLSWVDLSRRAQDTLTLGQLIDTAPVKLAHAAAEELQNLFKIGVCLHGDFSKVTPFLRLLWAERYSEFDGPADFRDLGHLPRWTEVPFVLRREMQMHADWLYSRVDAQQSDALELIHDLIRVGLLLASHAPVDQLITGSVAEETTPARGGVIKLQADPLRIRLGMMVVVEQPSTNPAIKSALVRAVVEDIAAGHVSARIESVSAGAKLDPKLATVRFLEGARIAPR